MEIKAGTKIKDLSKKDFKKVFKHAIFFCEQNLGLNRRKSEPLQVLWLNKETKQTYGWYDPVDNSIQINADCKTVSDLTKTLIHEWTHHLQPILSQYGKLYKKYGYANHPMEIEAYDAEKKWNRKMLAYLRSV
jgi:hypothetical protein